MASTKTRNRVAALLVVAGVAVLFAQKHGSRPPSEQGTNGAALTKPAAPRPAAAGPRGGKRASATAPAAARRTAVHPQPRDVVVRAAWGSGPQELGRTRPTEGAPIAPPAFAVDAERRVHVLDQVNSRIQVFDGSRVVHSIPLPADTYQDIALDGSGQPIVMDRLATATLAFVGDAGEIRSTVSLTGPGVPEGGGVTGLFPRPDGVWVEVEHSRLVRVALPDGAADPTRPVVAGRFAKDGASVLRAAITNGAVEVVSEPLAEGGAAFRTRVELPLSLLGIHALEQDGQGRTYVVANTIREAEAAPYEVVEERETAVVIGKDGKEITRIDVAPPEGPEEQLRPIVVGEDGSVYQLVAGDAAATIERFAP